jgi:hypothetical protein
MQVRTEPRERSRYSDWLRAQRQSPDRNLKLNSVALVRERTIPTERPPLVVEVSAKFRG